MEVVMSVQLQLSIKTKCQINSVYICVMIKWLLYKYNYINGITQHVHLNWQVKCIILLCLSFYVDGISLTNYVVIVLLLVITYYDAQYIIYLLNIIRSEISECVNE